MNVSKYVKLAIATDRLDTTGLNAKTMPLLGLAAEIGLLLAEMQKEVQVLSGARGTKGLPQNLMIQGEVKKKLGNIIWHVVAIARRAGLDFQKDILLGNLNKLAGKSPSASTVPREALIRRQKVVNLLTRFGDDAAATFNRYQACAWATSKYKTKSRALVYLVQISQNGSELISRLDLARPRFDADQRSITADSLGDVMWYVAAIAKVYSFQLNDVVADNIKLIYSRWPPRKHRIPTGLYDSEAPKLQQIPRKFTVEFIDWAVGTKMRRKAIMLIDGVVVGDQLTDNSYDDDGYRFHDALHLANLAILGWSPVFRSLLKRKRKFDPQIDEVEDGARAQIVEEAIVKITHSYASKIGGENLLNNQKNVRFELLKWIHELAEGHEVAGADGRTRPCEYWEWERAILEGFRVYGLLRENGGGRVSVDLEQRSIKFRRHRKKAARI